MIAILLLGLAACTSAAPRNYYHHPPPFSSDRFVPKLDDFLNDEIFDTRGFWSSLQWEMSHLDKIMADLEKRFSVSSSTTVEEDNKYKITIPLQGFDEKDIVVKAKPGMLMVQAVHDGDGKFGLSHIDMRLLPSYVQMDGSWVFEKGVLKITFPIKKDDSAVDVTTQVPEHSREVMESTEGNDGINDIEVKKLPETNEIPRREEETVEATTYAVDLKDEIEFVPMKVYK